MLERFGGLSGILGLVAMLVGIALIAEANLQIAGGIALVVAGVGLLVRGIVQRVLASMGMGGML